MIYVAVNLNWQVRSIFIFSSWLFATFAMAEEFNAKETFRPPVSMPGPIVAYLSNEPCGNQLAACHEVKALDLFEAQLVNLNATTKAYLVKPTRMCLCGEMIIHCDYLKLKESGSAAEHGYEAMYGWDRNSYTEIYTNVRAWDAEKNCRVGKETTQ
ncbi:MAG TPA: hypothetical protein DGR15_09810 [Methylophilus sp.]|nr:hypothetical protein [Methylophilus sp.]